MTQLRNSHLSLKHGYTCLLSTRRVVKFTLKVLDGILNLEQAANIIVTKMPDVFQLNHISDKFASHTLCVGLMIIFVSFFFCIFA
jgi:hypothetical protein